MVQAADALSVSRVTIHRWIEEKKLSAHLVGSGRMVPRAEVEWLQKIPTVEVYLFERLRVTEDKLTAEEMPVPPVTFLVTGSQLAASEGATIEMKDNNGRRYLDGRTL